MVSTRGTAASPTSSPATTSTTLTRLTFNEKLSTTTSSDVLLKKLKSLYSSLSPLEQGTVQLSSLTGVKQELINPKILLHKDKGVKAYAGCCMAELLRLYAPDAPYTSAELRDMFQFFFNLLINLKNGSNVDRNPYFQQYFLLLESLSTVKSIVIVCDLPNADELISMLFREAFKLTRTTPNLGRNVEIYLSDLLIAIIDESQAGLIPSDALNTLMSEFKGDMSDGTRRLLSRVCEVTSDKLQRGVTQYFGEVLMSTSPGYEEASDNEEDEGEKGAEKALHQAHSQILSIALLCPPLLSNILPLLSSSLLAPSPSIRLSTTQTLAKIFASSHGAEYVRKYGTVWKSWTGRRNDKDASVRAGWVGSLAGFFGFNVPAEILTDIEEGVFSKLLDPVDTVRVAACALFSTLPYEALRTTVTGRLLRALGERGLDKKNTVRAEALNSLGKIWSLAYPDIEKRDPIIIDKFGWIVGTIMKLVGHSAEAQVAAEETIATYVLPLPSPLPPPLTPELEEEQEQEWVHRLLIIWKLLEDKERMWLLGVNPLKSSRPNIYQHYVSALPSLPSKDVTTLSTKDKETPEEEAFRKQKLAHSINILSRLFPDSHRAGEDLYAFAKGETDGGRIGRVLWKLMDVETTDGLTLAYVTKLTSDLKNRLTKTYTSPSSSSLFNTLMGVWRRSTFWLLNTSTASVLLKMLTEKASESDKEAAVKILCYFAKWCPALLKPLEGEFEHVLRKATKGKGSKTNGAGLVEVCLAGLAGIAKSRKQGDSNGPIKLAKEILLSESVSGREAKFAARILSAYVKDGEAEDNDCTEALTELSSWLSELPKSDEDQDDTLVYARVAALSEFSKSVPNLFAKFCDDGKESGVMQALLQGVLMKDVDFSADQGDVEWLESDEEIPPLLHAKIQALKICRNRCLTVASSDQKESVTPVFQMLFQLLENEGSLRTAEDGAETEHQAVLSRVRLNAGISLLHLATVESYLNGMAVRFVDLALVIQDTCFEVRFAFLKKLISMLQNQKLDPRFNILLFLTVLDPEKESRERARNYVTYALKRFSQDKRIANFEMIFIRFLHLLAHHPDFDSQDLDRMQDITKYLTFYLDLIANADNAPLLFHIAIKAKTVRDAESPTFSENLYVVSEMAAELIKARAKLHAWSLPSYPGKVKLPADIFKALPSSKVASEILKKQYMSDELATWLATEGTKQPKPSPVAKGKPKATGPAADDDVEDDDMDSSPPPPPRRKRGRPPKSEQAKERARLKEQEEREKEKEQVMDIDSVTPVKRGPGRPPKRRRAANNLKEEADASSSSGEEEEAEAVTPTKNQSSRKEKGKGKEREAQKTTPIKRGPGRPPKRPRVSNIVKKDENKDSSASEVDDDDDIEMDASPSPPPPPKRGPGRPRKVKPESVPSEEEDTKAQETVSPKRTPKRTPKKAEYIESTEEEPSPSRRTQAKAQPNGKHKK